jgi:hypothetical protein
MGRIGGRSRLLQGEPALARRVSVGAAPERLTPLGPGSPSGGRGPVPAATAPGLGRSLAPPNSPRDPRRVRRSRSGDSLRMAGDGRTMPKFDVPPGKSQGGSVGSEPVRRSLHGESRPCRCRTRAKATSPSALIGGSPPRPQARTARPLTPGGPGPPRPGAATARPRAVHDPRGWRAGPGRVFSFDLGISLGSNGMGMACPFHSALLAGGT